MLPEIMGRDMRIKTTRENNKRDEIFLIAMRYILLQAATTFCLDFLQRKKYEVQKLKFQNQDQHVRKIQ